MLFVNFIRDKTYIALLIGNIPCIKHLFIGMIDALRPFHFENGARIIILVTGESIHFSYIAELATH
jgi:hypothetical protein